MFLYKLFSFTLFFLDLIKRRGQFDSCQKHVQSTLDFCETFSAQFDLFCLNELLRFITEYLGKSGHLHSYILTIIIKEKLCLLSRFRYIRKVGPVSLETTKVIYASKAQNTSLSTITFMLSSLWLKISIQKYHFSTFRAKLQLFFHFSFKIVLISEAHAFLSARFSEYALFRAHAFAQAKLNNETFFAWFLYTVLSAWPSALCLGTKVTYFPRRDEAPTLTFKPYLIRFVSWLMSTIIKGWADEEPSWSLSKSKADWWGEDVKAAQLSNLILLKKVWT